MSKSPPSSPATAPEPDCPDHAHQASTVRQQLMFSVALVFLVLLAFALHQMDSQPQDLLPNTTLVWVFFTLWTIVFVESLLGYWKTGDYTWPAAGRLLLLWLIPPFRMALSTAPGGRCLWLPMVGWAQADHFLFDRLERAFSLPMLLIASLILPILAVEYLATRYLVQWPTLALILDIATAVIWLAFAFELVLMTSVSERRLPYLARNWINVVIVLLPLLAFLRGLRLARALRVGRAMKMLKVYRLRGLGMRAWRGVVALELIERIIHRKPEARLAHLTKKLRDREKELEVLRRHIEDLEQRIAHNADRR